MHPVIIGNLEEYMSGALMPVALREFESHLQTCPACREEVRGMQEISTFFTTLQPAGELAVPPAGFASRVTREVAAQPAPSFWSLFSLDVGFGRRVVFASLLTMAVLGSYLVSREIEYAPAPSPEAIMASDQSTTPQAQQGDRDKMLVTLTSYEP